MNRRKHKHWLRSIVCCASLCSAFAQDVRAVDTVWTGATSNNFFTAGNWTAGAPGSVNDLAIMEGGNNLPAIIAANVGTVSLGAIQIGVNNDGGTVVQNGGTLIINGDAIGQETVIGGSASADATFIMNNDSVILYDEPIVSGGTGLDTDGTGKDFDIGKSVPDGSEGRLEMHNNSILRISDDLKISDGGGGNGSVLMDGNAQMTVGSGISVAGVSSLTIAGNALLAIGNSAAPGDSQRGRTNEGYLTLSTGSAEESIVDVRDNGKIYARTLQQRGGVSMVSLRNQGQFHVFDVFEHAAPALGTATVVGSAQGPQRTSHLSSTESADTLIQLYDQSVFTVDSALEDSSWSGLAVSGGDNRGANAPGGITTIEINQEAKFAIQQDLHLTLGTGATAESTLKIRGADAEVSVGGDLRLALNEVGDPNPGKATLAAVLTGPTHSTISVGGAARIGNGSLLVEFDGYTPRGGESYQLISAGSIDGNAFREVTLPALPQGLTWNLQIDAKTVHLRVSLPGDFNSNGQLDAADIDLLSQQVRAATNPPAYDLNGDNQVNDLDRTVWVNDLKRTYLGDSNLDGEFNTTDFVSVFQAGQYEDNVVGNSGWATGDWNGDAEFNTTDFVAAFQAGGYEQGPRPAVDAVPEPAASLLIGAGLLALGMRRKQST